jgi:hypothetical protein
MRLNHNSRRIKNLAETDLSITLQPDSVNMLRHLNQELFQHLQPTKLETRLEARHPLQTRCTPLEWAEKI